MSSTGPDHNRFIEVSPGRCVHLRSRGPVNGRPVLLLHGWPQDSGMWGAVIERLGGDVLALAPDLRGFGASDGPERGLDAGTFVGDQLALLDALGIEQVDVVGHDWGGWTGLMLALDHPERVRSLVAISTPHPWTPNGPATLAQLPRSWYAAAIAAPLIGPALLRDGGITRSILTRGGRGAIDPESVERYVQSFRPPERAAAISSLYRYYLRALGLVAAGHWRRRRLEVPTVLLHGEGDRLISPAVVREGLAEHADSARLELLDAGHFLCDERPDLVAARARELLQLSS